MSGLYRPNVAAIMLNTANELLVCERKGFTNSWQFPQGGVDKGETLMEALHREMDEELGLEPHHYDVILQRGGYRYQFPNGVRRFRRYIGQEQTYFLCRMHVPDTTIRLDKHKPEFCSFRWVKVADFRLGWLPEFKRHVYKSVIRDFFQIDAVE
jgi:putative (di)nucleoside polyphosphate hydrolase